MALEKIQQAVKSSAQTEADHVLKAAERSAQERVETQKEAAGRDAERQYQAATRAIDEEFARKLLQAKGVSAKQLLEKRNALLLRVFQQARQQVLAWNVGEYAAVMGRLLERAAGDLGGKLRIHPKDSAAFARVLAEFNARRDPAKQVTVDETRPLPAQGGFVFVSDTFEVDQTVDTLLKDMEHELAPRIAAEIFQD